MCYFGNQSVYMSVLVFLFKLSGRRKRYATLSYAKLVQDEKDNTDSNYCNMGSQDGTLKN